MPDPTVTPDPMDESQLHPIDRYDDPIYDAMCAVTVNLGDDYDLHPMWAAEVATRIRDEAVAAERERLRDLIGVQQAKAADRLSHAIGASGDKSLWSGQVTAFEIAMQICDSASPVEQVATLDNDNETDR